MAADRFLRAFDDAARDFERLGDHLWKPIGRATADRTAPAPGERVLDACCGTGASAIPAAERVGGGGHVDAIDLSEPLIRELTRLAAGLPQLHPRAADATTWPGTGYDVLQVVLGIFFLPDMAAGTAYLIGRLRPGGRAGLTIWRRGAVEVAGRHLSAAVTRVTGTEIPRRPTGPLEHINEAATYRPWLEQRGLTGVEVVTHELTLHLTPELAWLLVTGSGYVAALTGLTPEQVDAVRETYLDSLSRDGVDELDATTLIGLGSRP
ncbi:methyltransferase domain-containing protein [Actinoplanes sp. NPDC023714]|uniref:class I SAM-dependent methyltransferase n=1 Tax=Actinoplanes sp. NPDC023714 TaxID=3154322 RepID=UPI0033D2E32A